MKILNFGSCNIDLVYTLDHIVSVGETETTYRFDTFPGGKGLNQSIAAAKAGADVYHAGCLGRDGSMLRELLVESGANTDYLKSILEKNGHAVIQVSSKGENSIFLYPGSNEKVTKEWIDEVLENFAEGDMLLLQNEISTVDYLVKRGYEKGMCIVLNPSPFNEKLGSIDLNMLSYVIANEVEARELTGCSDPKDCIAYFKEHYPDLKVMLTLGSRGCIYADFDHEIFQPAYQVDVVDTTAAGDTFTGYFVAGVANGMAYEKILKMATAASAISVTRKGAAPSIPDRHEVLYMLKNLKLAKSVGKDGLLKDRIDSYLEENIASANLAALSQKLGYSTVYTGNLIKKITGQSFSKLVQSKRCSLAAELLSETDISIEEIIRIVGYENESFFRKIFKEKYGVNPLEYKKRKSQYN